MKDGNVLSTRLDPVCTWTWDSDGAGIGYGFGEPKLQASSITMRNIFMPMLLHKALFNKRCSMPETDQKWKWRGDKQHDNSDSKQHTTITMVLSTNPTGTIRRLQTVVFTHLPVTAHHTNCEVACMFCSSIDQSAFRPISDWLWQKIAYCCKKIKAAGKFGINDYLYVKHLPPGTSFDRAPNLFSSATQHPYQCIEPLIVFWNSTFITRRMI